jgi:radical SAM superfamily enzyme YgiQ (UPF0313 family)
MISRLSEYEVVGFSCYKSNYAVVEEVASLLRQQKPSVRVIAGGPEVTRRYFRTGGFPVPGKGGVDYWVAGEGETPLLRYLKAGSGETKNSLFEELRGVDLGAVPDYSDFNFAQYPRQDSISIIFSRGCIRACAFCAERLLYKRFRVSPVRSIIETIRYYRKKGVRNFIFHDSLINGNLPAMEKLCEGIIKNFGAVNWEAQIAVRRDMPDRMFRRMKESGCYHLFVGLESGSDAMLRAMKKGFGTRDALNFFRQMDYAGLSFGVSMITGFPGETEEHFQESLKFLIRNKDLIPKIEQVNPFVYYDGTGLPEEADYKYSPQSLERAQVFIQKIKEAGFKFTNAFMLNLVEERADT